MHGSVQTSTHTALHTYTRTHTNKPPCFMLHAMGCCPNCAPTHFLTPPSTTAAHQAGCLNNDGQCRQLCLNLLPVLLQQLKGFKPLCLWHLAQAWRDTHNNNKNNKQRGGRSERQKGRQKGFGDICRGLICTTGQQSMAPPGHAQESMWWLCKTQHTHHITALNTKHTEHYMHTSNLLYLVVWLLLPLLP